MLYPVAWQLELLLCFAVGVVVLVVVGVVVLLCGWCCCLALWSELLVRLCASSGPRSAVFMAVNGLATGE